MFKHVRTWVSAVIIALVAMPALAQHRITTSLDNPQQVMEGWGTSLAQWDDGARATYRTQAFREAYRDLGLNILRADMRKEVLVHSPNDYATPVELGGDLQGNLNKMDFTIEEVKIYGETIQWLKNNAFEPERVKMSGSLWSPPHWMKGPTGATQNFVGVTDNHPTPFLSNMVVPWNANNPRPTGASVGGRLKTEDPWTVDQYGKYIASWVAGFEAEYGVPMDTISLQNESTFENPFDSMTYRIDENGNQDFSQYAKGLKAVKDAWEQFELETRVMGPHVAGFPANPGNPFRLWQQDMMIQGVKNHPDFELIDFLDFYNANFYNDTDEGNVKNIAGFWRGGDDVAPNEWTWHTPPGVEDDGKGIWFSETGEGGGNDWPANIATAVKIHTALVHGQASAYVYWQFTDGGSSNAPSTHTLVGSNQLDDPLQSKKYAAFKQYSRYIRPGAVRLDAGFDTADGAPAIGGNSEFDPENSLNVAAFLHEEDAQLTFVLLNATDTSEQVTLAIPEGLEVPVMELFRTSETESFTELGIFEFVDGELLYTAPAQSVSTFTGTVIPEPTGLALTLLGGLGLLRRRRAAE